MKQKLSQLTSKIETVVLCLTVTRLGAIGGEIRKGATTLTQRQFVILKSVPFLRKISTSFFTAFQRHQMGAALLHSVLPSSLCYAVTLIWDKVTLSEVVKG